jgi:hypothetical protein
MSSILGALFPGECGESMEVTNTVQTDGVACECFLATSGCGKKAPLGSSHMDWLRSRSRYRWCAWCHELCKQVQTLLVYNVLTNIRLRGGLVEAASNFFSSV